MAEKEAARRRLAFDELLRVQTVLVMRKRALERDVARHPPRLGGELVGRFHGALPFELTGAQQRAIGEIEADLAGPHPMHRLLQGDVGAGKTVVAVSALLTAVQGGHQGALMAPTEVLAEQHAAGVRRLLDGVTVPDPGNLFGDRPLRVELLTNRVTGAERREVLAGLGRRHRRHRHRHARADPGGRARSTASASSSSTSSTASASSSGPRCGTRPSGGPVPDVLVMTATPIPRTAAMTVYGDLDVSVLDELPPGRTPIATHWANGPLDEAAVVGGRARARSRPAGRRTSCAR